MIKLNDRPLCTITHPEGTILLDQEYHFIAIKKANGTTEWSVGEVTPEPPQGTIEMIKATILNNIKTSKTE